MTPVYTAGGGAVMVSEFRRVEPEKAAIMRTVHLCNADYWLTRGDLSPMARETMAGIDRHLAEELAAAIQAASEYREAA